MPAANPLAVPRAAYAMIMAGATMLALACTWVLAQRFGGGTEIAGSAVLALAIGSFATFAPALLHISAEYWGVAVFFCGAARGLLVVAVAYGISNMNPEMGTKALFYSAVIGAGLVLLVETVTAVVMLSKIESQRTKSHPARTNNGPASDRT